jgi:hypothetical protein
VTDLEIQDVTNRMDLEDVEQFIEEVEDEEQHLEDQSMQL